MTATSALLRSRLYKILSKFTGRYIARCRKKYGVYPVAENSSSPDEPDVVDAGVVVEGVGVDALRRGRRVRRVGQ
jgi:hypothetical protein